MANRRMLSKTISTSIKVARLKTTEAKLMFSWMIPHCDDDGRMQGYSLYVKGIVFPMIDCTIEDVESWLSDMVNNKLIEWYDVDGEKYIQINKWLDFQEIRSDRKKDSKYPRPNDGQMPAGSRPDGNHMTTNDNQVSVESQPNNNQKSAGCPPNLSKDKSIKDNINTDGPKGPSEKKTNPDIKKFLDFYHENFLEKFNEKPVIDGGKDGAIVKRLLSTYGLDRLKGLLLAFFKSDYPFILSSGYTIGVFKSQINKLITNGGKKRKDDIDYSRFEEKGKS